MVENQISDTQGEIGEGLLEYWSCNQVTEYLGITTNHLRQLQHRQKIKWKKQKGRNVYYLADDIREFKEKRRK